MIISDVKLLKEFSKEDNCEVYDLLITLADGSQQQASFYVRREQSREYIAGMFRNFAKGIEEMEPESEPT